MYNRGTLKAVRPAALFIPSVCLSISSKGYNKNVPHCSRTNCNSCSKSRYTRFCPPFTDLRVAVETNLLLTECLSHIIDLFSIITSPSIPATTIYYYILSPTDETPTGKYTTGRGTERRRKRHNNNSGMRIRPPKRFDPLEAGQIQEQNVLCVCARLYSPDVETSSKANS